MRMQRDAVQQRLAERRRRSSARGNNSMMANSSSLKQFGAQLQAINPQNMAGTVIGSSSQPQVRIVDKVNATGTGKVNKNKDGEDYVKKIINGSVRGFGFGSKGLAGSTTPKSSNFGKQGPSFGQSKLGQGSQGGGFGNRSNYSGQRSSTTLGGGLASRLSLALSRVIEPSQLEGQQEEDEIFQLIDELNNHQDLTVKLNNQSKICSIFSKNEKSTASAISKKKDG